MATPIKSTSEPLYEQDFYAWSKAQADLLRAGRFADLDLGHLIEEVDDLGESVKRSVRSRLRTIIEYLLKLEHSPAQAPRDGWYDTFLTQRSDLLDEITASIRPEVEPTLPDLYDTARQNAATSLRKHGEHAAGDALPAAGHGSRESPTAADRSDAAPFVRCWPTSCRVSTPWRVAALSESPPPRPWRARGPRGRSRRCARP